MKVFFFYSENKKKAMLAVGAFRKKDGDSKIFLGITVRDLDYSPGLPTDNPFVFSDDTVFDGSDFFQWADEKPGDGYNDRCTYLDDDGKIVNYDCDQEGRALCVVESTCANSGSERSRANLSIFALFVAGSAFNALHALAGFVF